MRTLLLVSLLAILPAGCGGGPPKEVRSDVSGKVTFDGAPVSEGTITFDQGNGFVPGNAEIRNGTYNIAAQPGKNKVIIRAFKIDPTIEVSTDPVRPTTNRVNYIPDVYNDKSTLTADVTAEKRTFDFDLTSKKK